MRKLFVRLMFFASLATMVCACGNEGVAYKAAERSYAIGEYHAAAALYKKSYSRCAPKEKAKRAVRAYMMGDCYRRIGLSAKAVAAYQNAIRYQLPDSMVFLHAARQQLKVGQYKQAEQNFRKYLTMDADNELARNGLESCNLAVSWKETPNKYQVKKEAVFNSRRAEFSPMIVDEDASLLVLSSTRKEALGDDRSGITGGKLGDLFLTRKNEQGKWLAVEAIEGEVNSEYDEGASCLSPDGKIMYFTRCSSDPNYPRYAEIWQSQRSDASWGKPSKCAISKDTLSSFAHPAVSPDGEWLYFVSDSPGGEGGLDIWRTRIMDGGFGGMENLGRPINTAGDEMFPSFRPNGDLYFSSDGHPGMGGLDIFIARADTAGLITIENQQYPLNSSADDFGMTFEGVYNRGFFSSSRNDGKGWEHIYSFELPEIVQTVTGWVYEKDGYELPEAQVRVVGNDGTNVRLSVRGDGSFTHVLNPGVDYVMLATCAGYLNVSNQIRVEEAEESEEYTLQFPLPPINVPVLIDNIFYEFDSAELTPESAEALDRLVTMLDENPNITIELSAHCDYRGNDSYNLRLSQRRAESVVRYLIAGGVDEKRLTAVGYGETRPKVISKKLAETLLAQEPKVEVNEADTLTEAFILARPDEAEQEVLNALNRRTEFRVLRTTFGTTLLEYDPQTEAQKAATKREDETNAVLDEDFVF